MKSNTGLKKQKAINLRLRGKSYGEIMKILGITSKGTLSYWLKNLELTQEANQRLERNVRKAFEGGLMRFNRERTRRIRKENAEIFQKSIGDISDFSHKTLLFVGAALYWGEGYKRQSKQRTPQVSLGNTDPYMIKIFLRFVREILHIPEEKIMFKIQIHPGMKESIVTNFWSRTLNVSEQRFRISRQVSRASKGVRPVNIQPYGTMEVRISSRKDFFRIMGWIKGMAAQV